MVSSGPVRENAHTFAVDLNVDVDEVDLQYPMTKYVSRVYLAIDQLLNLET